MSDYEIDLNNKEISYLDSLNNSLNYYYYPDVI